MSSSHSHFSRHRTSRGEVSNLSFSLKFSNHTYGTVLNPTFEMSSECIISIRQMSSSHPHFSRHKTSRGEVSNQSFSLKFSNHTYATVLNPTFEMSGECIISIRQMSSSHSHFSRHRTSRGEVSSQSFSFKFSNHTYAMALNPKFEMSSERSISIRQMSSSHSHFFRHRSSRGEVSNQSFSLKFSNHTYTMALNLHVRCRVSAASVLGRCQVHILTSQDIGPVGERWATSHFSLKCSNHIYAMALNPICEMSSEHSISIRKMSSSHSHFSRHRTSWEDVSNQSFSLKFSNHTYAMRWTLHLRCRVRAVSV